MSKKATGEVKKLLRIISEIQGKVGMAKSHHDNDRDMMAFEKGQRLLEEAFELCLKATAPYDPESYELLRD